jgi:hypothetical protein
MKSNNPPLHYFSKLTELNPSSARTQPSQSPYLKAILSGNFGYTRRIVPMTVSDRLAAIRYIKESMWRNNFFRG